MPNLSAAASQVQSLPDQALQSELTNPTGLIPTYLVLAEAQRRQLTRQAQQKEQAQQSSSVYDDVVRNMMAKQPPSGLPAPPAGMTPPSSGQGGAPSTPGSTPPNNFQAPLTGVAQKMADGGEFVDDYDGGGGGGGGGLAALFNPTEDESNILDQIKRHESGGDYTIHNKPLPGQKPSTASGAYQFINGTWQNATRHTGVGTEFATAAEAPPQVQDINALWLLRDQGPNSTASWGGDQGPKGGYHVQAQLGTRPPASGPAPMAAPQPDQPAATPAPAEAAAPNWAANMFNPEAPASPAAQPSQSLEQVLASIGAKDQPKEAKPPAPLPEDQTQTPINDYLQKVQTDAMSRRATIEQLQAEAIQRYQHPNPFEFLGYLAQGMNHSGSTNLASMFGEGVGYALAQRNAAREKAIADYTTLGNESERIENDLLKAQALKPETLHNLTRPGNDPLTGQPYQGSWTLQRRSNPITGTMQETWLPQAVAASGQIRRGNLIASQEIATMLKQGKTIYLGGDTATPLKAEDLADYNGGYFETWLVGDKLHITPTQPTMRVKSINGVDYVLDPTGKPMQALGAAGTTSTTARPELVPDGKGGWTTQIIQTVRTPQALGIPGVPGITPTANQTAAPVPGAPQAGITGPGGGAPVARGIDITRQQLSYQRGIPATEATIQLFGDPAHPEVKSLNNYAHLADNADSRERLGAALRLTFNGIDEATGGGPAIGAGIPGFSISSGGDLGKWLSATFGAQAKIAEKEAGMVRDALSKLTPEEREAYYKTLNAYATIVGLRSLTPGTRSQTGIATVERELPTIGLYTNSSRDFRYQQLGLASEIARGAALVPQGYDQSTDALRQFMIGLPERTSAEIKAMEQGGNAPPASAANAPPVAKVAKRSDIQAYANQFHISEAQAEQEFKNKGFTIQ